MDHTFATLVDGAAGLFCRHAYTMLIQSSLLVGMILVIDLVIRKRARAVVRYWLWMLVLVKLVLPPNFASPISLVGWVREGGSRIRRETATPSAADRSAEAWQESARHAPRLEDSRLAAVTQAQPPSRAHPRGEASTGSSVSHPPVDTSDGSQTPEAAHLSVRDNKALFRRSAFMAWILGAAAFSLVLLCRLEGVRRLRARARPTADHLRWRLESACRAVRILPRRVRVRLSSEVAGPVICGAWKPTVLVPEHLVDELHPDDERAIFVHELTHLRRGDLHVSLLQAILQVVYFYNPAVWIANHYIRKLREQAVDEAALVSLNKDPCDYSDTLVLIASLMPRRSPAVLGMVSVVESTSKLSERIDHILSRPVPWSRGVGVCGATAIILAGALLVPMVRIPMPSWSLDFLDEPSSSPWPHTSGAGSAPDLKFAVRRDSHGFEGHWPDPLSLVLGTTGRGRFERPADLSSPQASPLQSLSRSSVSRQRPQVADHRSSGMISPGPSSPASETRATSYAQSFKEETTRIPAHPKASKTYFVERPVRAPRVGAILRANLDGTEVETVLTGLTNPGCLAVADGRLYWSEQGTPCIRSVKLNGSGPAMRLATAGLVYDLEVALAARPGIYFACSLKKGSSISFVPADGTPVRQVVSRPESIRSIALIPTTGKLYWSELHTGRICRSSCDGGPVEEVFIGRGLVWDIDYDAKSDLIYWAESSGQDKSGKMIRAPQGEGLFCAKPDGTNVRKLTGSHPVELAIDSDSRQIYAAEGRPGGRIWRCNLDGSGLEIVVEKVDMAMGLAVVHPSALLEPDPFENAPPATQP